MNLAFATCDHQPLITRDDQLLADALAARGVTVTPIPPPALLSFADQVVTHVPSTCLYARVDVVESSRGPLLMELELIEPELYFLIVPEAANRFADLLVTTLRQTRPHVTGISVS